MKKLVLTFFAVTAVIFANAANWTITVTTQKQIKWYDKKTGQVVAQETVVGRALTFDVVADTPRDAENRALHRCSSACNTDFEICVESGVAKNGKICDKYEKEVTYQATATLK